MQRKLKFAKENSKVQNKSNLNLNDRELQEVHKAPSSSLLRLLSSHTTVRQVSGNAIDTSTSNAPLSSSAHVSRQQPTALTGAVHQQQTTHTAAVTAAFQPPEQITKELLRMKECPLCGQHVPAPAFEAHFQEETKALAQIDFGADYDFASSHLPSHDIINNAPVDKNTNVGNKIPNSTSLKPWEKQQSTKPFKPTSTRGRRRNTSTSSRASAHFNTTAPRVEADGGPQGRVLVIGGQPSSTVPSDKRLLKQLVSQQLKKKRNNNPLVVEGFNHYQDGGGFMDGDAVGLDFHENVGTGWEGMGTTTF